MGVAGPASRLLTLVSASGGEVEVDDALARVGAGEAVVDELVRSGAIVRSPRGIAIQVPSARRIVGFGDNGAGQLGDGTTQPRPSPVPAVFGYARAIAMGADHSLAAADVPYHWSQATQLYAWGDNSEYALGDGTNQSSPVPVRCAGLGDAATFAAGSVHSLAVRPDGSVWIWGSDYLYRVLGGAAQNDAPTPVRVPHVPAAQAVAASQVWSLVLDRTGKAWAWGFNQIGELGVGSSQTSVGTPTKVKLPTSASAVAAGVHHGLALAAHGNKVYAWGSNGVGELCDGTLQNRTSPVAVKGLPRRRLVAVAATNSGSLALAEDGTLWGWGVFGAIPPTGMPPKVAQIALSNVKAIACGYEHALAVLGDGTVWEITYTGIGQPQVAHVGGIVGAVAVTAGEGCSLALCRGQVEFDPQTVDFGDVAVGATAGPQTVTLANTGSVPVAIWQQPWSGTEYLLPGPFSLVGSLPAELAPGASATLTATFSPSAQGAVSAWPLFSFDCTLMRLTLTGTGV
jgi:alpha-tubulin suppressor-like RCC1 family protein